VARKHPDHIINVKDPNENPMPRTVSAFKMLSIVVRTNLSFRVVEDPEFREITGSCFSGEAMSRTVGRVRAAMIDKIKDRLDAFDALVVTMDEWTDCREWRYLGIRVQGASPTAFQHFCLAHWFIQSLTADAEHLSDSLRFVLTHFGVLEKVQYVVTDTTPTMPATVHRLRKSWMPCFAHVFNLILCTLLKSFETILGPLMNIIPSLNGSTKWAFFVHNARYSTIPTWTQTRWYSMYELLEHVDVLRDPISAFLRMGTVKKDGVVVTEIPEGTWAMVPIVKRMCQTFKKAVELLESDRFGTLGFVLESWIWIRKAVEAALPHATALQAAWHDAQDTWKRNFEQKGVREAVLMAVELNICVDPDRCLSGRDGAVRVDGSIDDWAYGRKLLERNFNAMKGHTVREVRDEADPLESRDTLFCRQSTVCEWQHFLVNARRPRPQDFDLWGFWQDNKNAYPTLFALAQKFLSIPATSAACERQFSRAKLMKPRSRARMGPETLSGMLMIQQNPEIAKQAMDELTVSQKAKKRKVAPRRQDDQNLARQDDQDLDGEDDQDLAREDDTGTGASDSEVPDTFSDLSDVDPEIAKVFRRLDGHETEDPEPTYWRGSDED
jgi:hypothetical protein